MAQQILINASGWETRVAVLDDTTLLELHVERGREHGIAGNIYKGKVVRVLPGMQAAFVDIGLEKAAFLHVSDLTPPAELAGSEVTEELLDEGDGAATWDGAPPPRGPAPPLPPIEERLEKGAELIVQVAKEPIGSKGARVTARISLPGRYLVLAPGARHLGLSRRIEDVEERDRLRAIVEAERPPDSGLIVRTACEGASKREIRDDVRFLTRLWTRIQRVAAKKSAPALIHQDLDLVLRTVRDLFTTHVERLSVDAAADHARVLEFVQATMPRLASRVHHYQGVTPIFEQHGVESKITRALERRVWLKSGGYLVIEQTESLTAIDVNTGRYVGKKSQEETVLRTNLEAAKQVVAQLRLRNLGGIIVIDFIDMEQAANRKQVFDLLQDLVRTDKARTNILRISELGLVQMTRKRTRESLGQLLSSPCPHCQGSGRVRSIEGIAAEALRRAQHEAALHPTASSIVLRVHPDVAAFLNGHRVQTVGALEALIDRPITVEGLPDLGRGEVEVSGEVPAVDEA